MTNIAVKYLIEHPDTSQLEVRLSREDVGISQTMWEMGKNTLAGTEFGKATDLEIFRGTPSQGQWYLWIRDAVPGQSGRLKDVNLMIDYAPTGPMPVLLSGEPGRPTSLRVPAGSVPSTTPDHDKQKSGSQGLASLTVGAWQDVKRETFEGAFPNAGWTLLDDYTNDNREYLWDDDDFRPHNGYFAGWPANGGANWLDPATNSYPPNSSSWMIYAIDLSNAKMADVDFWLWRQIQANCYFCDRFFWGVRGDPIDDFAGYMWDGSAGWEEKHYSLDGYLGDSSVYVAWYFQSNATVQYEGPWVDDILIRKYVPGQVQAQGTLTYSDRNGNNRPARYTKVSLYDQNPGGTDEFLGTTTTDANGFFRFPVITNWDNNDSSTDPNIRRRDLYVVWAADYNDSGTSRRHVIAVDGFGDQTYKWNSIIKTNAMDGTADFTGILPVDSRLGAMWIFQDLRRAWETIYNNTSPHIDPGPATAIWQQGVQCYQTGILICSSFFWGGLGGPFVFIADVNLNSADTVVHETGHHYMYNATEYWTWWDTDCFNHNIFSQEDVNCAWTEGWGDFLALVVNNDVCYDWGIGPCGTGPHGGAYIDIEAPNRQYNPPSYPWGDEVEGRVAGALYDLWDSANEPDYDNATFGLGPIAHITLQGAWPPDQSFLDFWLLWQAGGQSQHQAVEAIYQNTIDYDFPPLFNPALPDLTILQNISWTHALDLWDYTEDYESTDAELSYEIYDATQCGATVDSHWVNLTPQTNWLGSCPVSVFVSDGIKTEYDTFWVHVVPVADRVYLPIILK